MTRELVYESQDLALWQSDRASPAYTKQVSATVFGSSGIRYQRLDAASVMQRFAGSLFFEAVRDNELIGTYLLARRPLRLDETEIDSFYRGQLTVAPHYQSRGIGKTIVRQALARAAQMLQETPALSWGFVEENNDRSLKALRSIGGKQVGTLASTMIYRQLTRRHVSVAAIEDQHMVNEAIRGSNVDCGLQDAGVDAAPFYGIRHGDEIVAGCRASHVRINMAVSEWSWHKAYGAMIDLVPPARRRFDPRHFQYVHLYDVVVRDDSPAMWNELVSDLMRRHGVHMAMFSLDPDSQSFKTLQRIGLFGWFARATRQTMKLVAIYDERQEDIATAIRSRPIALSPIDM